MFDTGGSMPISGSAFVAVAIYAGASLFITGQVIGDRTIQNSGWQQKCETAVRKRIAASEPAPNFTPNLNCNSLLGTMFGQRGQSFCRMHGDNLGLPLFDQLQDHKRRLENARSKRLEAKAEQAGSRCSCAVGVTLEKRRVPLAIYAGTLRLVTPQPVKDLNNELLTALNSPLCAIRR